MPIAITTVGVTHSRSEPRATVAVESANQTSRLLSFICRPLDSINAWRHAPAIISGRSYDIGGVKGMPFDTWTKVSPGGRSLARAAGR